MDMSEGCLVLAPGESWKCDTFTLTNNTKKTLTVSVNVKSVA